MKPLRLLRSAVAYVRGLAWWVRSAREHVAHEELHEVVSRCPFCVWMGGAP